MEWAVSWVGVSRATRGCHSRVFRVTYGLYLFSFLPHVPTFHLHSIWFGFLVLVAMRFLDISACVLYLNHRGFKALVDCMSQIRRGGVNP